MAQFKSGVQSSDIDVIFRGSSLRQRSSLELGWKDLAIERRSGDPGERSEEVINKYYAVLWDTQPCPVESLHEQLGVHDEGIQQLMSLLSAEADAGGPSGKLYVDSLSHALAARFRYVARPRKPQQENPKESVLPRRILQRVIERMRTDFSANLDLATLATESGYSRAHFLRMFHAATGKTPHQYLLDIRLNEVQRRMRDSDERLIDIATDCGFCSHSHLSKVFRQKFGVTPSEYRRKL